jgi:hypothetical protein
LDTRSFAAEEPFRYIPAKQKIAGERQIVSEIQKKKGAKKSDANAHEIHKLTLQNTCLLESVTRRKKKPPKENEDKKNQPMHKKPLGNPRQ